MCDCAARARTILILGNQLVCVKIKKNVTVRFEKNSGDSLSTVLVGEVTSRISTPESSKRNSVQGFLSPPFPFFSALILKMCVWTQSKTISCVLCCERRCQA